MARARLRDRHQQNLRRKLQLLKREQGVQPAASTAASTSTATATDAATTTTTTATASDSEGDAKPRYSIFGILKMKLCIVLKQQFVGLKYIYVLESV